MAGDDEAVAAPPEFKEIAFEDVAAFEKGDIITPGAGEIWPGGVTIPLALRELDPVNRTMTARTGVTEQNPHGVATVTVQFPPAA